jgi:hypothetical protein
VKESDVVGTPYWMAPEIISLSGAQYTSDIWSVGCMVIEMLTGKPPYFEHNAHTAFYKIIMDLHPPLPPGCSPAVEDFLLLCLKKEPGLRPSASQLLQHPWIVESTRITSERNRTMSPSVVISPNFNMVSPSTLQTSTPVSINSVTKQVSKLSSSPPVSRTNSIKLNHLRSGTFSSYNSFDELPTTVIQRKLSLAKTEGRNSPVSEKVKSPKSPGIIKKESEPIKLSKFTDDDEDDDFFGDFDDIETDNLTLKQEERDDDAFRDLDADMTMKMDPVALLINHAQELLNNISDVKTCEKLVSECELDEILVKAVTRVVSASSGDSFLVPILNSIQSPVFLQLVYMLVQDEQVAEILCMLGLFSKLATLVNNNDPSMLELICDIIVDICTKSATCMRMFIACQGLSVIIKLIQNGSDRVVDHILDLVLRILSLGGQNVKRDFCRLFATVGFIHLLVERVSLLVKIPFETSESDSENDEDDDDWNETSETVVHIVTRPHIVELILTILFILSMFGDSNVKICIARETEKMIQVMDNLDKNHKLIVLQCVRNISIDLETQDILTACGTLPLLVHELAKVIHSPDIRDPNKIPCKIYNQSLHALHFMCYFNQFRKDIIVKEGAIAITRDIVLKNLPLQELALPLLLGFGVSNFDMFMKQDPELTGFFHILAKNLNWSVNVLVTLHEMLSKHTKTVEPIMTKKSNVEIMVQLFTENRRQQITEVVIPFAAIVIFSDRVAFECALYCDGRLPSIFSEWICDEVQGEGDVKLLRALRAVMGAMFDAFVQNQIKGVEPFKLSSLDAVRSLYQFAQKKGLAIAGEALELYDKFEKYFIK